MSLENPQKDKSDWGDLPSEDFIEGKVPFEFSYVFPDGKVMEVLQDKDGIGNVVIRDRDQIIFNATSLLPSQYKLVTPTYFLKFPEERDFTGSWTTDHDRKIINLGEFKSPQDLLSILHEIGHSANDKAEELKKMDEIDKKLNFISTEKQKRGGKESGYDAWLEKEDARLRSRIERRAWAWALNQLRELKQKRGLPTEVLFPTFEHLKKYVDDNLASYRRAYEWIVEEGYDPGFYKELKELFDKGQYVG